VYENIPIAEAENYTVNCQENKNALPAYRITEVDILAENTTAVKKSIFFAFSEPRQFVIGANQLGNQINVNKRTKKYLHNAGAYYHRFYVSYSFHISKPPISKTIIN